MKKNLKSVDIKRGKYRFRTWINDEKGVVAVRLTGVFENHHIRPVDGFQGVAKIYPGDTFNQDHGIKLAIDRVLLKMAKQDLKKLEVMKKTVFKDLKLLLSDLNDVTTERMLEQLHHIAGDE